MAKPKRSLFTSLAPTELVAEVGRCIGAGVTVDALSRGGPRSD
jgi:hypothetical protein